MYIESRGAERNFEVVRMQGMYPRRYKLGGLGYAPLENLES